MSYDFPCERLDLGNATFANVNYLHHAVGEPS